MIKDPPQLLQYNNNQNWSKTDLTLKACAWNWGKQRYKNVRMVRKGMLGLICSKNCFVEKVLMIFVSTGSFRMKINVYLLTTKDNWANRDKEIDKNCL